MHVPYEGSRSCKFGTHSLQKMLLLPTDRQLSLQLEASSVALSTTKRAVR